MQNNLIFYLEYCQFRKELSPKTLKAYRIDLKQYMDFVGAAYLEKKMNERFITELHKKYKPKTIKRKIASIKAFFSYLEEEEIISNNPYHKINVKFKESAILPKIIPREEIEMLLNFMYQHKVKEKEEKYLLRDIAVVELCFSTGARVSEISNIRLEDINLTSGLIRFMGKGGKERCVQIADPSVLDLLQRYYSKNKVKIEKSGYFLINKRGNRFTEQSIRIMIKKYSRKAGIRRNITPHMFRHSFATYLIEEGMDITCVQKILGHSSIKTTQIYIHLAAEKQAEILQAFHPRKKMHISAA